MKTSACRTPRIASSAFSRANSRSGKLWSRRPREMHDRHRSALSAKPRALLHLQQLDLKEERLVRPDVSTGTAFAVREGGGDIEHPLRTFLHELQRLGPSFDDPIHRKFRRLAA